MAVPAFRLPIDDPVVLATMCAALGQGQRSHRFHRNSLCTVDALIFKFLENSHYIRRRLQRSTPATLFIQHPENSFQWQDPVDKAGSPIST